MMNNELEMALVETTEIFPYDGIIFKSNINKYRDKQRLLEDVAFSAIWGACNKHHMNKEPGWLKPSDNDDFGNELEIAPTVTELTVWCNGSNDYELLAALFNVCRDENIHLRVIPINVYQSCMPHSFDCNTRES